MLEWILSSTVLIGTVIALRWLFRNRLKMTVRYALWGLVLVRLLLPLSIGKAVISVGNWVDRLTTQPVVQEIVEIQIPVQSQESAYREALEDYRQQGVHVDQLDENTLRYIRQEAATQVEKRPLGDLLTQGAKVLWLVGAAVVAGFFLHSNGRFGKALWSSSRDTGLRKGKLPVFTSENLDSPCLFGIRKPAIFVTEEVLRDPTLLRHTLEHEATHHRHGDHIWAVLRGLCLALHWYNPLVWIAAVLSQRDGEMACDEATVARLGEGERAEYGRTLIGMTCGKKNDVLLTATRMTNGSLRQRILMIAKKPKMAGYILVAVALMAAVAVGCTFVGSLTEHTQNTELTEPSQFMEPTEEIWDTRPYITYEGTQYYDEAKGIKTILGRYVYAGELSEEDARYSGQARYQIYVPYGQELPNHFYLYGETGTMVGNTYKEEQRQMAYTLYGTVSYQPENIKELRKAEWLFRSYVPGGTYLGNIEEFAFVYVEGEIPKIRIFRYQYNSADDTIQVVEELSEGLAKSDGMTVNVLRLKQGDLYFGSLPGEKKGWDILRLICMDGWTTEFPIQGEKTWFHLLDAPLGDFQILSQDREVLMDYSEYFQDNLLMDVSPDSN